MVARRVEVTGGSETCSNSPSVPCSTSASPVPVRVRRAGDGPRPCRRVLLVATATSSGDSRERRARSRAVGLESRRGRGIRSPCERRRFRSSGVLGRRVLDGGDLGGGGFGG